MAATTSPRRSQSWLTSWSSITRSNSNPCVWARPWITQVARLSAFTARRRVARPGASAGRSWASWCSKSATSS